MILLQKKNNQRDNHLFFLKKWAISLVLLSGFVSCKSTDCGCPMAFEAEQGIVEPTTPKVTKQKSWKKTLKVD